MTDARLNPKSVDGTRPHGAEKPPHQEKASTVEVAPPPYVIEDDPKLTPEDAEKARKKYLLKRFWISARGYWSRGCVRDRLESEAAQERRPESPCGDRPSLVDTCCPKPNLSFG